MKEIFNKLAQLSLVNRKCKQIAGDKALLNELAKRYSHFHPQEAQKEFLHYAMLLLNRNTSAEKGFLSALKLLLGRSTFSADYKKASIITATLTSGININITDQVVSGAINKGNSDLVQLLLDNGTDVNAKSADGYGYTALIYASSSGNKEIVKLLLGYGADVNAVLNNGCTALIVASVKDQKEIVKLLLDSGAEVNAAGNDGETALMFASKERFKEIVKLLLERGAKVNAVSNNGKTALMFANDTEIIDLLQSYS